MSPQGNQRAPPSRTIKAANIGIETKTATVIATLSGARVRTGQRDVDVTVPA
jgi:hypothetical protein